MTVRACEDLNRERVCQLARDTILQGFSGERSHCFERLMSLKPVSFVLRDEAKSALIMSE